MSWLPFPNSPTTPLERGSREGLKHLADRQGGFAGNFPDLSRSMAKWSASASALSRHALTAMPGLGRTVRFTRVARNVPRVSEIYGHATAKLSRGSTLRFGLVGSSYSGRIFPEILAHPGNSLEKGWGGVS